MLVPRQIDGDDLRTWCAIGLVMKYQLLLACHRLVPCAQLHLQLMFIGGTVKRGGNEFWRTLLQKMPDSSQLLLWEVESG